MHIICEDQLVSQSALSRSARLADMHRVDPGGYVRIPCDTSTWTAWLADDPSQLTASNMDVMLSVIMVRSQYNLELVWLQAPLLARILSTLLRGATKIVCRAEAITHRTMFEVVLNNSNLRASKHQECIATIHACTVAHHVKCRDLCLQMLHGDWHFGKHKCNRCRKAKKSILYVASTYVQVILRTPL
jgi:hypothetical protein